MAPQEAQPPLKPGGLSGYLRFCAFFAGLGAGVDRGAGGARNICRITVSNGTASSAYSDRSTRFAFAGLAMHRSLCLGCQ